MADHKQIESRLNTDEKFRKKFLENPVDTLREEGVELTADKEEKLRQFAQQARAGQISTPHTIAGINGGIAISIRF